MNEEDTSFLNSFDCPYISPYDNTSLIIPVNFSSTSPIEENSNVLVIINPGVGVACNNSLGKKVNIGLLEPFSWSYVTNAQIDEAGPVFNTCEVSIVKKSGDVLSLVESKNDVSVGENDLLTLSADFISKYALSEKKLKAKIRFSDNGVGPDSLVATIRKHETYAYSDKPFTFDPVEKPVDIHITGISANACTLKDNQYLDECYIDLSDIPPEMESIFSIQFTAIDKKGQKEESDIFYFVYDFTPPKKTFPFEKHSEPRSSVIKLSKSEDENNKDKDLNMNSIEINGKLFDTQDMYLASITKNGKYYTWSNKITYTVTVTDYAGNSVTTNDTYTNTYYPEVGHYFYSDGSWSSEDLIPPLERYLPEGVEKPKLVGVITAIPEKDGKKDYSNVTVFHNQMLEGSYCLVPFTSKDKVNATKHGTVYDDGLTVKNYYKQFSDIYYSGTRVTKSNGNTDSLPSLYYYLDHVFTSPDDPNHLDWYLPSVSEFIGIGSSCLKAWVKNDSSPVYGVPTCSTPGAPYYYYYTSMNLTSTNVSNGTDFYMFGNLVNRNPPDNYDCIISKVIPAAQVDLTKYY